jgi:L-cysteine desulfidase
LLFHLRPLTPQTFRISLQKISGFISANLYKNAMGVTIPGTTVCGVPLAAAIGAFGGDRKGLKTLEDITPHMLKWRKADRQ